MTVVKKQLYTLIILFALIIASSLTSLGCYSSTSRLVSKDMERALALTLKEQHNDVISQDTIRTFNNHLQIVELRGKATLAVDTHGPQFKAYASCSKATIFGLSDQRPATILWFLTILWALLTWHRRQAFLKPAYESAFNQSTCSSNSFGGLTYSDTDNCFYAADGTQVLLTPMQHQLMEMFFHSPSHSLTKTEIYDTLWPKKPDASDTLYTLIRRLKPIVEQHSELMIESDRSKSYRLRIR